MPSRARSRHASTTSSTVADGIIAAAKTADPSAFEAEFRQALRATAQSGRILEINTRLPLHPDIVKWWHEEGGAAVTFGSDAHLPSAVARGFRRAADMAEAKGFRHVRDPYDFWPRVD